MSFNALLKLNNVGTDNTTFDIFFGNNIIPDITNIDKSEFILGYTASNIPNVTNTIKIQSNNSTCSGSNIILNIQEPINIIQASYDASNNLIIRARILIDEGSGPYTILNLNNPMDNYTIASLFDYNDIYETQQLTPKIGINNTLTIISNNIIDITFLPIPLTINNSFILSDFSLIVNNGTITKRYILGINPLGTLKFIQTQISTQVMKNIIFSNITYP